MMCNPSISWAAMRLNEDEVVRGITVLTHDSAYYRSYSNALPRIAYITAVSSYLRDITVYIGGAA